MSTIRLYTAPAAGSGFGANPQEALAQAQRSLSETGGAMQVLRRTGGRPVRFHGTPLANAIGWTGRASLWHEINLYNAHDGRIIVEIRVFKKSPQEKDCFHVFEASSLEDAMRILEQFDPRQDVIPDLALDDPQLPIAEISLRGIALRQRIEEVQLQYATILGDLLFELETAIN